MGFNPVPRERAFERVVAQIEAAIYSGEFQPGEVLPNERELVEQFEVSRSTIREALRILESMGLVTVKPGSRGGPVVNESTTIGLRRGINTLLHLESIQLEDLIQYRIIVGSASNYLACHFRTDEQLTRMQQAIRDMEASVDIRDNAVFAKHDNQFHQAIREASGNSLIKAIDDALSQAIVQAIASALTFSPQSRKTRLAFIESHWKVYEAIERRDDRTAYALAKASIIDHYSHSPLLKRPEKVEVLRDEAAP